MVNKTKRAIGYCRVSTAGQAEDGVSLDAQRAALTAWAERAGFELLDIEVEVVSGGAELSKRSGLLRALARLAEERAEALVVYKRDRLARDVVTAALVERMAQKARAAVVAVEGTTNGAAPEDVLLRTMVDAFAQYERALIAQRTRVALAHKRARGERTGTVRRGYRLAEDGVSLVQDDAEQRVLRMVRELRQQGLTVRAIAIELEQRGVLSRCGKPLGFSAVGKILRSAA
jgi:DNA invertase Pin-like site-specific DNA recombinase